MTRGATDSGSLIERFHRAPIDPLDNVFIETGSIADYARLAAFHYLAGPPATHVRVLAARHDRETVGVLVVSMPTLDGGWRDLAWPGRYRAGAASERSACLKRLNDEVRTISRVVVEPRWRGLGVARRLVEAYLVDPLTERTEAVCTIGALCPFFRQAGMREIPVPVRRCTVRLADAAAQAIPKRGALSPGALRRGGLMRRELRRWWREHKTTRGRPAGIDEMAREAFAAIVARRSAYVSGPEEESMENKSRARAGDAIDRSRLPHPLTLFLSASERARVLAALRRIDRDRARAILIALGLEPAR